MLINIQKYNFQWFLSKKKPPRKQEKRDMKFLHKRQHRRKRLMTIYSLTWIRWNCHSSLSNDELNKGVYYRSCNGTEQNCLRRGLPQTPVKEKEKSTRVKGGGSYSGKFLKHEKTAWKDKRMMKMCNREEKPWTGNSNKLVCHCL